MKSFALVLVSLALTATSASAQGGPQNARAAEVLRELQGTWEVVSMEQNGEGSAPLLVDSLPTITFNGNDFTWGDGQTGRIVAIDAARNPVTIDYQYTSGPRNGLIDFAILRIDGDTFMDCMADPGQPRPAQFSTVVGTGRTLVTYRRTSTPRGPGLILNPWFYVALAFGLFAGVVVFVLFVTLLIIWLSRPAKADGPKTRRRGRYGRLA